MNRRVPVPATGFVVLAAALAGMLFAPVFGVPALLLPILVPAAAVLLVALLCARGPALAAWRPLLTAGAGLLAVAETAAWPTTVAGLPTAATGRAIVAGVTESWRLALQSTWPARPEPALLLFVPLLVVAAAVLGVEVLHRLPGPRCSPRCPIWPWPARCWPRSGPVGRRPPGGSRRRRSPSRR